MEKRGTNVDGTVFGFFLVDAVKDEARKEIPKAMERINSW
jgi:hypothetical protein